MNDVVVAGFHPPIANNYVHMWIPRTREPAAYLAGIERSTAALNRADHRLLEHCAGLLAARPDPAGSEALARWRDCIERRVNLQGIRWVPTVVAAVERGIGGSIGEHLARTDPAVLERFREIPQELVEIRRINAYLPPTAVAPALARLIAAIEDGELEIDRLEVARLDPRRPWKHEFPTVIVYLAAGIASPSALRSTLQLLRRSFDAFADDGTPRRELAWPLGRAATVTEGFTLYKRYLRLLGILDERYDPRFEHAICRGSPLAELLH